MSIVSLVTHSTILSHSHFPRRVVIVHGYGANPTAHWFPWLRSTLSAEDVDVSVVELPSPQDPQAQAWESAVATVLGRPDEHTWIIGHSLGGVTSLRVLDALEDEWRLGGLVLVAAFTGPLKALPILDGYLRRDVDAERLASHIAVRAKIRSDDDPFVPPPTSDRLARRLGAEILVRPRACHFLDSDGIIALPLITEIMAQKVPRSLENRGAGADGGATRSDSQRCRKKSSFISAIHTFDR